MFTYTGIGSRDTPENVLSTISVLANYLAVAGWCLRSGGAIGADTAFENGCDLVKGAKEIYLPWKGYNRNPSPLHDIPEKAFTVSKKFHPHWERLSPAVRKIMARNAQQILGKNLDCPCDIVVCWTPDGCTKGETRTKATGGTGQAIAIASALNIPVFNLRNTSASVDQLLAHIKTTC